MKKMSCDHQKENFFVLKISSEKRNLNIDDNGIKLFLNM